VTSDLKQRLIDTWASISQNVIDEALVQWRKRLHAKIRQKEHLLNYKINSFQSWFYSLALHNRLSSQPPTVYRGKHVALRHFHRSYLKAKCN